MSEMVIDQLMARAAAAGADHKWVEAVALYEVALARAPDHVPAMLGAAAAARANGDHARAVVFLARAERSAPGRADVAVALGDALTSTARLAEAAEAYARARAAAPLDAAVAARLGAGRLRTGDAAGAVSAFEAALALDPAEPLARSDIGAALAAVGRPLDALAAFRRLDDQAPRLERALALLTLGDMAGGFVELDRLAMLSRPPWAAGLPDWDGGPLAGRLAVWAEHGPVELSTMLPALPLVRPLVGDILFVVPRSFVRMAGAVAGVGEAVTAVADIGPVGAVAPLSGLPARLGLTAGGFRVAGPLVRPEPALVERWSARLALGRGRPAVGLVWGGRVGGVGGAELALADLAALADGADMRFIALERLPSSMIVRSQAPSGWEVAGAPIKLEHPGPDFEAGVDARVDSLAVLDRLDAVIAVDSTPLRLAGLQGRPGVALLPATGDWAFGGAGGLPPRLPSLIPLRAAAGAPPASLLAAALRHVRGILAEGRGTPPAT